MDAQHPQATSYIVTIAVIAIVLVLRMRGLQRARRLRLETLWIVPLLLLAALGATFWQAPPATPLGWLWPALALAAGAALGWRRGKLMRISVDPATGTLNQQSSPAALLFIVALLIARQGIRFEASRLGIDLVTVTSVLMALAVGLIAATRIEMFLRARAMLGTASVRPLDGGDSGGRA